ncbi:hypothetical protein EW145_g4770 [Phellinidium pouzarii]|uniref:Cyclase n=1 Tax=Phellinidium pouzarii TaxID=167371 RepID=A0A4S4L2B7_9AGAM|nr:hypothetical protein EW145_g4770 [Phellinidium pouzarii]
MLIYDLSHKLDSETQPYPGDPVFSCHQAANIKEHGYNLTSLTLGSHTGTHIDAPYHFLEKGKTIDELDLSLLIGPAAIVDVPSKKPRERITWDDLVRADVVGLLDGGCRILLVRTGWSRHWKSPTYLDHPFLDRGAAEKLVKLGVRVLGVDTMNPDETPDGSGAEGDFGVHEIILGADSMIVENLTGLEQLPGNHVHVSLLPLNIAYCDGSPIRAVAWIP